MTNQINSSAIQIFDRFKDDLVTVVEKDLGVENIESYEGIDKLRRKCPTVKAIDQRLIDGQEISAYELNEHDKAMIVLYYFREIYQKEVEPLVRN